ncbi:hypothetical protein BH18GEM1_BH18GEM1_08010 [soil metagenome]
MTGREVATGLAALLLSAAPLTAQRDGAAAVTARLEPASTLFGGTIDLVVEITTPGVRSRVEEPRLPDLPAVVVGQSRESQVQLDGSGLSRRLVYRYRLGPVGAGVLRVDPIRVVVDGQPLYTPALEFVVSGGGLPADEPAALDPPSAWTADGPPPFLVTTRVDRDHVIVGEQVTLTFAFYHDPRAPLAESPDYDPPATPGFWRLELDPEPRVSVERIGPRVYHVQRFRYAIFPLHEGSATIGPATVRIVEPEPSRWWRAGDPRSLRSDPLRIDVEPLPAGAPPGYGGAVGRYSLRGAVQEERTTAGIPLELELTVAGIGNPTTVGAPALPAWPDVAVRPSPVQTETRVRQSTVRGTATFRYLLSPEATGRLDLGSARFAFYDPAAGRYEVDSIALGEIEVLPAPAGSVAAERPRRTATPMLWPAREPSPPWPSGLARRGWFWVALGGPWLAWLAVGAARSGRDRTRRRNPGRGARQRLARARRAVAAGAPGSVAAALAAVDDAVEARFGEDVPVSVQEARLSAREALQAAAYSECPVPDVERALVGLEAALEERAHGRVSGMGPYARLLIPAAVMALGGVAGASPGTAGDPPSAGERWQAGNDAYRTGEFRRAADAFRKVLRTRADAHLEANLAAALWRQGERGRAVIHYRHAILLSPREPMIRGDFSRLLSEIGDPPVAGSAIEDALSRVRMDEVLLLLLIGSALVFVLPIARWRSRIRGPSARGAFVIVLLAALAAMRGVSSSGGDRAVAVREATIAAAPGGPVAAALPEGSIVALLERRVASWRVRTPGLPAGWVAPEGLIPLSSSADHSIRP